MWCGLAWPRLQINCKIDQLDNLGPVAGLNKSQRIYLPIVIAYETMEISDSLATRLKNKVCVCGGGGIGSMQCHPTQCPSATRFPEPPLCDLGTHGTHLLLALHHRCFSPTSAA